MKKTVTLFRRNSKYLFAVTVLAISMAAVLSASHKTVPASPTFFTFSDGTVISASQMNDNFKYLIERSLDLSTSGTDLYYNAGNVGIGTATPIANLHIEGTSSPAMVIKETSPTQGASIVLESLRQYLLLSNESGDFKIQDLTAGTARLTLDSTGNVGIGTTSPGAKLEVAGQVKITGGTPGAGNVLTSDAAGLASWQAPAAGADGDWTVSGNDMSSAVSGNVGIGTTNPTAKLDVVGSIKSTMWNVSEPIPYSTGSFPRTGTLTTNGGTLMLFVAGTAFRNSGAGPMTMEVSVDGILRGTLTRWANEAGSHKSFPSAVFIVTGLAAGSYPVQITIDFLTTAFDANDYSQLTVLELPF